MNLIQDTDWVTQLLSLPDNWDEEGAPTPSAEAVNKAQTLVDYFLQCNLNVESIDPDVLGGVGIYLRGVDNKTAWITILNNGNPSIILRHSDKVKGHVLDDYSVENLKTFLVATECNACNDDKSGQFFLSKPQDNVVHTFPKEEIFVYGDVEQLHDLLIVKNVEAWRALPEKMRKHLMCTTEWQYYFDDGMALPNLIINDLEIRWNGSEWAVMAFHSE